jgi:hypothetical protein
VKAVGRGELQFGQRRERLLVIRALVLYSEGIPQYCAGMQLTVIDSDAEFRLAQMLGFQLSFC